MASKNSFRLLTDLYGKVSIPDGGHVQDLETDSNLRIGWSQQFVVVVGEHKDTLTLGLDHTETKSQPGDDESNHGLSQTESLALLPERLGLAWQPTIATLEEADIFKDQYPYNLIYFVNVSKKIYSSYIGTSKAIYMADIEWVSN